MNDQLDNFYGALKALDAQALSRCVTEDFELLWQGTADIPWAGSHAGVAGLLAFVSTLNQHVEVLDVQRLHTLQDATVTVVILRGQWRMRRTGRVLRALAANVLTLREGRIASYVVLNDSATFAAELALGYRPQALEGSTSA